MRAAEVVGALDVGGTHVTAALVARSGLVAGPVRGPLDSAASSDALLDAVVAVCRRLPAGSGREWGVAMPDPFDYHAGVGRFADVGKFEAWNGVDVGSAMRGRLAAARIAFGNDADAFALGEWLAGAARGADRVVGLTLGTGVGTGWVAGGRVVVPASPPGGRAHRLSVAGRPLEDVVSRRAIIAAYRAAGGHDGADVREIAAAARAGDGRARDVLAAAFGALGRALAPAVTAFAPDVVVVGGSMARSWALLQPWLVAGWREVAAGVPAIRIAEHSDTAALVGAAQFAISARR